MLHTKKALRGIPEEYRKTFTVDNDQNLARQEELAKSLKGRVCITNSYHPWERDLNENTNGLLRQYLPKMNSFEDIPQKELAKIVTTLDNKPRDHLATGHRKKFSSTCRSHFKLDSALTK